MYNADTLTALRQLPSESFDMCLTDPPWGISYTTWHGKEYAGSDRIVNDDRPFVWWLYDAARLLRYACTTRGPFASREDFSTAMRSLREWR